MPNEDRLLTVIHNIAALSIEEYIDSLCLHTERLKRAAEQDKMKGLRFVADFDWLDAFQGHGLKYGKREYFIEAILYVHLDIPPKTLRTIGYSTKIFKDNWIFHPNL